MHRTACVPARRHGRPASGRTKGEAAGDAGRPGQGEPQPAMAPVPATDGSDMGHLNGRNEARLLAEASHLLEVTQDLLLQRLPAQPSKRVVISCLVQIVVHSDLDLDKNHVH